MIDAEYAVRVVACGLFTLAIVGVSCATFKAAWMIWGNPRWLLAGKILAALWVVVGIAALIGKALMWAAGE